MPPSAAYRFGVCALLLLIAVLPLASCGGDDDGGSTETASAPLDASAFQDCMLSNSVERGAYQEVDRPAPLITDLADTLGAEFFEAGKADDGLVLFYVFSDEAAAEEAVSQVEEATTQLADALVASGAQPELGSPSAVREGGVVLGLVPFKPGKEAELTDETSADVVGCLETIQP